MQAQKDRTLSQYRIVKSKRTAEKVRSDINDLKAINQELKKKIKYFMTLLEKAQKSSRKGVAFLDESSLRDPSLLDQGEITNKLGHTEKGEISNTVDPFELGSLIDSAIKQNPIKQLDYGSGKASPLSRGSLEEVTEESKEGL